MRMKPAKSMLHGLAQRRRRIRNLLADCRNSFRDVFGRVDSALGQDPPGINSGPRQSNRGIAPDWG